MEDNPAPEVPIGEEIECVWHCLFICGLTTLEQQDAIILEGFTDIRSFAELQDKDIHEMIKQINTPLVAGRGWRPTAAPQAVKITRRLARCLDSLVHWVMDKIRRGIKIDPFEFDDHSLWEALQEDEGEDLADTMDVEAPEKFTPDQWIQWEIELTNYLLAKRGTRGVPLSYVIRPDLRPGKVIAADDR
jgi:hypothetical protein